MAWFPISHTVPQYVDLNGNPYSGAVLKAYTAGTTTPIAFATSSSGDVQAGSMALNASGYPHVSGNVTIPYVEEIYKLMLYPTQAAADANSGELWAIDNIPISADFGSSTEIITGSTVLDATDSFTHKEISGTTTITLPLVASGVGAGFVMTARNAGTGVVTFDPNGSEQINNGTLLYLFPGDGLLLNSSTTAWFAVVSRKKQIKITMGFHATAYTDELLVDGSSIALTSGGTYNGVIYYPAYEYLYDNLADSEAPVAGGRGASAAADWAANKKITMPDMRDRVPLGVSAAGSITTVGALAGASTVTSTGSISGSVSAHTLTASEIPTITSYLNSSSGDGYLGNTSATGGGTGSHRVSSDGTNSDPKIVATSNNTGGGSHTHDDTFSYSGSASSVVQKSIGLYFYINF